MRPPPRWSARKGVALAIESAPTLLLGLQRTVGNAAVCRFLARQPAPAQTATRRARSRRSGPSAASGRRSRRRRRTFDDCNAAVAWINSGVYTGEAQPVYKPTAGKIRHKKAARRDRTGRGRHQLGLRRLFDGRGDRPDLAGHDRRRKGGRRQVQVGAQGARGHALRRHRQGRQGAAEDGQGDGQRPAGRDDQPPERGQHVPVGRADRDRHRDDGLRHAHRGMARRSPRSAASTCTSPARRAHPALPAESVKVRRIAQIVAIRRGSGSPSRCPNGPLRCFSKILSGRSPGPREARAYQSDGSVA